MSIYALTIGLVAVFYVIYRFKKTRLEKTRWAYPVFMATFPIYYFIFAIYGSDYIALGKEMLIGIIFFILACVAYKSNRKLSVFLVAAGCLLHAAYDMYHDMLFINAGTPGWWLEFCGSIDLILGLYLVYFGLTVPDKAYKQGAQVVRASS